MAGRRVASRRVVAPGIGDLRKHTTPQAAAQKYLTVFLSTCIDVIYYYTIFIIKIIGIMHKININTLA